MKTKVRVSGVLLAAGLSRRFGSTKQLADLDGRPLVRIAAESACASRLVEVVVVVGHDADAVTAAVSGLRLAVVRNADYRDGQGTSIRAGLRHVNPASSGAMFLPADQPGLTADVLDALVSAFEARPDTIVVPVYGGVRGAPVTFPRDLFPSLVALEADEGGRVLLGRHADRVTEVGFDTSLPLVDIDTPADRATWDSSRGQR